MNITKSAGEFMADPVWPFAFASFCLLLTLVIGAVYKLTRPDR